MEDLLVFAVGCACAALGGELFVHGLVGLANLGRLPKGVVAATFGAFATSSPELMVGITSAANGLPEIALGDVTGSNIVNLALILAIPLALFGMATTRETLVRDLPFALALFPVIGLAAQDGAIVQDEALLLLAVFAAWLLFVVLWALRNRTDGDEAPPNRAMVFATAIVGLATLLLAGSLIVEGATGLAEAAGLPAFFIGATIVALGTSVPELATVLVSSLRGHKDVGMQTILGSNVFNSLFIIPVAVLIHPMTAEWQALLPVLIFGFVATLFVVPVMGLHLGRFRGLMLLTLYAVYVATSVTTALR